MALKWIRDKVKDFHDAVVKSVKNGIDGTIAALKSIADGDFEGALDDLIEIHHANSEVLAEFLGFEDKYITGGFTYSQPLYTPDTAYNKNTNWVLEGAILKRRSHYSLLYELVTRKSYITQAPSIVRYGVDEYIYGRPEVKIAKLIGKKKKPAYLPIDQEALKAYPVIPIVKEREWLAEVTPETDAITSVKNLLKRYNLDLEKLSEETKNNYTKDEDGNVIQEGQDAINALQELYMYPSCSLYSEDAVNDGAAPGETAYAYEFLNNFFDWFGIPEQTDQVPLQSVYLTLGEVYLIGKPLKNPSALGGGFLPNPAADRAIIPLIGAKSATGEIGFSPLNLPNIPVDAPESMVLGGAGPNLFPSSSVTEVDFRVSDPNELLIKIRDHFGDKLYKAYTGILGDYLQIPQQNFYDKTKWNIFSKSKLPKTPVFTPFKFTYFKDVDFGSGLTSGVSSGFGSIKPISELIKQVVANTDPDNGPEMVVKSVEPTIISGIFEYVLTPADKTAAGNALPQLIIDAVVQNSAVMPYACAFKLKEDKFDTSVIVGSLLKQSYPYDVASKIKKARAAQEIHEALPGHSTLIDKHKKLEEFKEAESLAKFGYSVRYGHPTDSWNEFSKLDGNKGILHKIHVKNIHTISHITIYDSKLKRSESHISTGVLDEGLFSLPLTDYVIKQLPVWERQSMFDRSAHLTFFGGQIQVVRYYQQKNFIKFVKVVVIIILIIYMIVTQQWQNLFSVEALVAAVIGYLVNSVAQYFMKEYERSGDDKYLILAAAAVIGGMLINQGGADLDGIFVLNGVAATANIMGQKYAIDTKREYEKYLDFSEGIQEELSDMDAKMEAMFEFQNLGLSNIVLKSALAETPDQFMYRTVESDTTDILTNIDSMTTLY